VSPEPVRRLAYVAAPAASTLTVCDRRRGRFAVASWGTGIRGLLKRATGIGGRLELGNRRTDSCCEVGLEVRLEAQP
jgi:hypothetical protein